MAITANEVIKAALRRLVVVPSGGTPTSNQYSDGLEVLNDMIESWSADYSLNYRDELQSDTINAGDTTATFTERFIEANEDAYLVDASSNKYNVRIVGRQEYTNPGFNAANNTSRPGRAYHDRAYASDTFYLDATSDQAYTLYVNGLVALTTFSDGTTAINMPEYYERAFKTNLTVEIAPEMGAAKRVTPMMMQQADDSLAKILGASPKLNASKIEFTQGAGYDIEGDSY